MAVSWPPQTADISLALGSGQIMCSLHIRSWTLTAPRRWVTLPPMGTLLDDLHAFLQEHRRCGELDGGFDGAYVWLTCTCGAVLARSSFIGAGQRVGALTS